VALTTYCHYCVNTVGFH